MKVKPQRKEAQTQGESQMRTVDQAVMASRRMIEAEPFKEHITSQNKFSGIRKLMFSRLWLLATARRY